MAKTKIAVVGANGRMGQNILSIAQESSEYSAELGVVSKGEAKGFKNSASSLKRSRIKVDVLIDFSSPHALEESLHFATTESLPIVIGTTGLAESHQKAMRLAAKKIPVLYAANMSLGVAALNEAIKSLALLEGFDFQIEETHHTKKKDSPSGTAMHLQKTMEKAVKHNLPKPVSLRLGGVYGNHRVIAASENEVLIFEHSALNRKVFAEGALRCASWLLDQRPGLYGIEDVLKK